MTVVFYTTGSIYALRTATSLASRTLLILSRIVSHNCYRFYATSILSSSASGGAANERDAAATAEWLFYELSASLRAMISSRSRSAYRKFIMF
jgi:hypothetical protein